MKLIRPSASNGLFQFFFITTYSPPQNGDELSRNPEGLCKKKKEKMLP